MLGGFNNLKPIDESVKTLALNHRANVESKLSNFQVFEPVEYQTQVVAGTNYQIKVHVGDGKHIMMKVHEPLPHTNSPTSLMECNHA